MKSILIRLAVIYAHVSYAGEITLIKECGVYKAEGNLQEKNGKHYLTLDSDTPSEIKVLLNEKSNLYAQEYNGLAISVELKITKTCNYSCEGEIITEPTPLAPFKNPKQFLKSELAPIKTEVCQ